MELIYKSIGKLKKTLSQKYLVKKNTLILPLEPPEEV